MPLIALVSVRVTIKARVTAGRLVVDEPTDLPEGTQVELLALDPGDLLDDADRAALHPALNESDADVAAWRSFRNHPHRVLIFDDLQLTGAGRVEARTALRPLRLGDLRVLVWRSDAVEQAHREAGAFLHRQLLGDRQDFFGFPGHGDRLPRGTPCC